LRSRFGLGIRAEAYCHDDKESMELLKGANIISPRIFWLPLSKILFVKERASAILLTAFLRLGDRDAERTTSDDSFLGNCLRECACSRRISLSRS